MYLNKIKEADAEVEMQMQGVHTVKAEEDAGAEEQKVDGVEVTNVKEVDVHNRKRRYMQKQMMYKNQMQEHITQKKQTQKQKIK